VVQRRLAFGVSSRGRAEIGVAGVEKTGGSASHYTVTLPRPVDPELASAFNRVFYGGS
jgi:hypothetical protein